MGLPPRGPATERPWALGAPPHASAHPRLPRAPLDEKTPEKPSEQDMLPLDPGGSCTGFLGCLALPPQTRGPSQQLCTPARPRANHEHGAAAGLQARLGGAAAEGEADTSLTRTEPSGGLAQRRGAGEATGSARR